MISSSSMMRMEAVSVIVELGASGMRHAGGGVAFGRRRWFGQRQHETEAGPLLRIAVARQRTTMLLDDTVRDREPEAGAAPVGLRREEGIVDSRQVLGRNADTRV